jgi:hypothetical protein
MRWTQAIATHATIVTSEADRAVMEVTIDCDFGWAASLGPRVVHRALNTTAQMTSLPNRKCSSHTAGTGEAAECGASAGKAAKKTCPQTLLAR